MATNHRPVSDWADGEGQDGRPQWGFEESVRMWGDLHRAPLADCLTAAGAILAEYATRPVANLERAVGSRPDTGPTLPLDQVVLLTAAIYQAGVDHASRLMAERDSLQSVFDVDVSDVVAILESDDLAWALTTLEPGHPAPAYHDPRSSNVTELLAAVRANGRTPQWQQLRETTLAILIEIANRNTRSRRRPLQHLASLFHHWGTMEWYDTFPDPPRPR